MSTLATAELHSDDSDDDFVPEPKQLHATAEDLADSGTSSDSDQDGAADKPKKKKRKRSHAAGAVVDAPVEPV